MKLDIVHFREIDSTNLEAKRNSRENLILPMVFISDKQLEGRGRLSRKWISQDTDGIYMSILFNTNIIATKIPSISIVAALSLCKSINKFVDGKALIKWPNDIVVGNKKICGILLESKVYHDCLSSVIVGVGINANNEEFGGEISEIATSIFLETGKKVIKDDLVAVILNSFFGYYNKFLFSGLDEIICEYQRLCISIGKKVIVKKRNCNINAIGHKIDEDGSLIVQTGKSKFLKVNFGDVVVQGIY